MPSSNPSPESPKVTEKKVRNPSLDSGIRTVERDEVVSGALRDISSGIQGKAVDAIDLTTDAISEEDEGDTLTDPSIVLFADAMLPPADTEDYADRTEVMTRPPISEFPPRAGLMPYGSDSTEPDLTALDLNSPDLDEDTIDR